jgi:hypothetical protein
MRIGNWPLMLLALEHIIKHPDQYDQSNWRSACGTFRCLAGWIAFFAGYRDLETENSHIVLFTGPDVDDEPLSTENAALTALELDPDIYTMNKFGPSNDASEELASDLFAGHLDLTEILTVVRDLAKADGVTPTPLIIEEMLRLGIVTAWDVF